MARIEDSGSYAMGSAIFYYMLGPNSWKEKNEGWILLDSAPPTEILIIQAHFTRCSPLQLSDPWLKSGHDGELFMFACPTYDTKWHIFTWVAAARA